MPELTRRRRPPRGMLAHLLFRRRSCRHNCRTRRQSARHRPMGLELRLLSRIRAGRNQFRTAATLEQARADFERAWQVFFSKRTEADFR
jgi:hypothetical protein